MYAEFQVILVGVNVYDISVREHHVLLNPGKNYRMQESDECIFIAQSPSDVEEIASLVSNLSPLKKSLIVTSDGCTIQQGCAIELELCGSA